MPDVLKLLPPFEWRGNKYPVTARTVTFNHEAVDHILQYRDFEVIEQTGARGLTFSYSIPMREDIAKGPYKNLFTEGLPVLFRDCLDRTPGALIDQIHGSFTCVPRTYNEDADPNKRDGVDLKIEFRKQTDVTEDEQIQPPTLQDVTSEAGALDAEVKLANWHQEPPPEGTTDILSAINTVLFQGQRAIDKISGSMNDLAFRCEKIENTVDKLTDPKNWPLRRDARRLRDAALRIAHIGETPGQKRAPVVTTIAMPISALAASVGMSVDQLLALNPQLSTRPIVPAGTTVRVPASA